MAVAANKSRVKTTIPNEVERELSKDAEREGISRSQKIAAIIIEHYRRNGRYPKETQ